jgi:hypothetical protein
MYSVLGEVFSWFRNVFFAEMIFFNGPDFLRVACAE